MYSSGKKKPKITAGTVGLEHEKRSSVAESVQNNEIQEDGRVFSNPLPRNMKLWKLARRPLRFGAFPLDLFASCALFAV